MTKATFLFTFAVLFAQQIYNVEALSDGSQIGHLNRLSSETAFSRHDNHLTAPTSHSSQTMIKIRAPADEPAVDDVAADDPAAATEATDTPVPTKKGKNKTHKKKHKTAADTTATPDPAAPDADTTKSPNSSASPNEPSFILTEAQLREPLEKFHPLLLTDITKITDVGARACKNPDMSPMGISTKECEDIHEPWSKVSLTWPDLLENFGVLGAGPGMEALASEWRAGVGKLRQQFGDDPFAFAQ